MAKKIKVLQVTGAMNRGGAEVMLMDIYRNISNDVHFDFLVNYKLKEGIVKGDFDDEIIERGATIKHITTQWDLGPIKYIKEFKKICKQLGTPDVVHIHLNAKCGVIALAAKRVGVKKIIAHSHADLKFRGSFISRIASTLELKIQKLLIANYANQYWACSQEAMDSLFYKRLQKKGASVIIKNAVDVAKFQHVSQNEIADLRQAFSVTNSTLIIGNVGRVVRHKNVDFIMDILKELTIRKIDFKFVFAGKADDEVYLDEIFKKARHYNVLDNVLYLESREDIPAIVNTFHVFVAPALQEGFGLVAVEAQAAGIPSVLYKGFPKSVDMHLNLVSFINDFDVSNWVNEILKMKAIKNTNKELIKNKIATLGYDIVGNTRQIEQFYKN